MRRCHACLKLFYDVCEKLTVLQNGKFFCETCTKHKNKIKANRSKKDSTINKINDDKSLLDKNTTNIERKTSAYANKSNTSNNSTNIHKQNNADNLTKNSTDMTFNNEPEKIGCLRC